MRSFFHNLIGTTFKVRPHELGRTLVACIYLFSCVGAFVATRIVRSALFLELPNYREQLPWTYVLTAIAVSWIMVAYAQVQRKLRRDRTNAITLAILMASTLGFRWALNRPSPALYWLFYVWVEIFGTFLIVQFWTLAHEIFHSREAKRLFAIIGGGGVVANMVSGFGIRTWVQTLGTENILFVVLSQLGVATLCVVLLGKMARAELVAAWQRLPLHPSPAQTRPQLGWTKSRHIQLICALVVLTYVVSTVVDYQFQVIIGDSIPSKDAKSASWGLFFGITGILGGLIQFVVTARLLERFGVVPALLLLPGLLSVATAGLLATPWLAALRPLWMATFAKGSENCLRYTINDSTVQLLYLPLPAHARSSAKTMIDGVLKPIAIGGTGLILSFFGGQLEAITGIALGWQWDVYQLGWLSGLALLIWFGVLAKVRAEYVRSLVRTLRRRRLNFDLDALWVTDESTNKTLIKALQTKNPQDIVHALELVGSLPQSHALALDNAVAVHLDHPNNDIRVAATHTLAASGHVHIHAQALARLLDDPAPKVRAAACLAYASATHEHALHLLEDLLHDPSLQVRSACVAALIRHGGLDGVLASADTLKDMRQSSQAIFRQWAAWILGTVEVKTFYQPLLPLLEDPNAKVAQAAAVAAGALQSPQLLPSLVNMLAQPRLAPCAMGALVRYGPDVAQKIVEHRNQITQHSPIQEANICRVLAKVGTETAAAGLLIPLTSSILRVREAAACALAKIRHTRPNVRIERGAIEAAMAGEIRRGFQILATQHDLALGDTCLLLRDALQHRLRRARSVLLHLLALRINPQTVDLVFRNLRSSHSSARANALEVLDNILSSHERERLLPLFDEAPLEDRLRTGSDMFPLVRGDRFLHLEKLLTSEDDWIRVCAAMAAVELDFPTLAPRIAALSTNPSSICRETAQVCLDRFQTQPQS